MADSDSGGLEQARAGMDEPLHVLDLPQLYQRPSAEVLLAVLADLSIAPPSWDANSNATSRRKRTIDSDGVPAYLTKIVASPLVWIENDDQREQIWESAAQRLSERSGRTAMSGFTRKFVVPLQSGNLELQLHEPALTADNLGLKTWASSYLLTKRLSTLRPTLPSLNNRGVKSKILELGAGTGLVGLAASVILQMPVVMTDLPDIVPNLEKNVAANADTLAAHGAEISTAILDWADSSTYLPTQSYQLILVADPIYSSEHPALLVQAINHHLSRSAGARVVIELPLRDAYMVERRDLRKRMEGVGLRVVEEGEEVGYDDWADGEELVEVRCWWNVWGWR